MTVKGLNTVKQLAAGLKLNDVWHTSKSEGNVNEWYRTFYGLPH